MKYIGLMVMFLLSGCCLTDNCGISAKFLKEVSNYSDEERENAKQRCIKAIQDMIDITPNEKKQCNFWGCIAGKETFRGDLWRCHIYNKKKRERK